MKIAALVARLLMGLTFLVFGLNGFLNFIPQQPMPDGLVKQYVTVYAASHYILVVSAIMVICAILFLVNRYVPLALTFIGPVIFNILCFHLLMAPSGILPGAVMTICWFIVFYYHRAAFAGIFQQKA